MKFEVVRSSDNRVMMSTEYESCIPYEHLDSMSQSGYYFRIDGKKVSSKFVKQLDNTTEQSFDISESHTSINKTTSKSVRCIDTGEIFKNQSEAARHFKIDPAQVSDSIKTGRPRSGYTFERVSE